MKKLFTLLLCGLSLQTVNAQFALYDQVTSSSINAGPFQFTKIPATGQLLFFAHHTAYGTELWQTMGAPSSATLVKDIIPGSASNAVAGLYVAYDRAYFVINDNVHGEELWVTDGTTAGTHIVTDYQAGPSASYPTVLMTDSIYAIVHAFDGADKGVYKTDGTSAGTIKFGGETVFYPPQFAYTFNGNYYYGGQKVYRSDGTAKSQVVHKTLADLGVMVLGGVMLSGDSVYFGSNVSNVLAQLSCGYGDFSGTRPLALWSQNGQNYGSPVNFYKNGNHLYCTTPCQYHTLGSMELQHVNTLTGTTETLDTITKQASTLSLAGSSTIMERRIYVE
jgi:ELWxxDGT repeat protein